MTNALIEERPGHRRVILRTAVIYTPGAVVATLLFLLAAISLITGNPGAIFAALLLALIAFAVDYEAVSALRDLRATPVETEGTIGRSWAKARIFLFGRVHYILVGRAVFEVNALSAHELREGDRVRIEHWPYTNTVIALYRVAAAADRPPSRPDAL